MFERVVAAIHKADTQGGVVTWNEKIEGNQFDVTIRFTHGLHEYLTVIECKDYKRRVSAERVRAFVLKARDVGAHKAVMVCSSDYQSGCFDVARRYNVSLFTLNEIETIPEGIFYNDLIPARNIKSIKFKLIGNSSDLPLDDYPPKMTYLVKHTKIESFRRK